MHSQCAVIQAIGITDKERIDEPSLIGALLCNELIDLGQYLVCYLSLVVVRKLFPNVALADAVETDRELVCAD